MPLRALDQLRAIHGFCRVATCSKNRIFEYSQPTSEVSKFIYRQTVIQHKITSKFEKKNTESNLSFMIKKYWLDAITSKKNHAGTTERLMSSLSTGYSRKVRVCAWYTCHAYFLPTLLASTAIAIFCVWCLHKVYKRKLSTKRKPIFLFFHPASVSPLSP